MDNLNQECHIEHYRDVTRLNEFMVNNTAENKLELLTRFKRIQSLCETFSDALHETDCTNKTVTCIVLPNEGKKYSRLAKEDESRAFNVYSLFKARVDQDPSRPHRLPGVIQLSTSLKPLILPLIDDINHAKSAFEEQSKLLTQGMDPRNKAKTIHTALGSSAFITLQITRKIAVIDTALSYIGITYHKKPSLTALSKKDVLNRLSQLFDRPRKGYSNDNWTLMIKESVRRVELLDGSRYQFRVSKCAYYRPMVNAKQKDGKLLQPSASIPVIVFTDTPLPVNLPRFHDNENVRSDRQYDPAQPNLSYANIHISKNNKVGA